MATEKEKADNLMLDMDNLMTKSGFSNYLFFCVGDEKEGGFASARMTDERGENLVAAQIIDTLRNNQELHDWFKKILESV